MKDIAIIGLSGRFPAASNVDQFWNNLINATPCIGEIPAERWSWEQFYSQDKADKSKAYSKWGGFIEDAYHFDPFFFSMSAQEAPYIDPQHRKILEVAYEAMEQSGYSYQQLQHCRTGVFLGVMGRGYFDRVLSEHHSLEGHLFTSSLLGFSANRISYHFNLTGPSLSIDTLCSSSLVALHYAMLSISCGECDYALAGGVYIHFSAQHYLMLSRLGVLSDEGLCKTFDDQANGIVSGEGAGLVLLKPLDQAIKDRDFIHAVIKGSFVNNDGRSSRFTATNPAAQQAMIRELYQAEKIPMDTIRYVETHGTGTALGDPIELMALKKVFAQKTDKKAICYLGSVKSNIGHLEPAAGIASLIKTISIVKEAVIPPTLHVQKLNHYIDLVDSPFIICDQPVVLDKSPGPLRAAVSSFGMGGTNAHVIVEAPPLRPAAASPAAKQDFLVTLSAKTAAALLNTARAYLTALAEKKESSLVDIAFTTNISRSHYNHRAAWHCRSIAGLQAQIQTFLAGRDNLADQTAVYRNSKPGKAGLILTIDHNLPLSFNFDLTTLFPVCQSIIKNELPGLRKSELKKFTASNGEKTHTLAAGFYALLLYSLQQLALPINVLCLDLQAAHLKALPGLLSRIYKDELPFAVYDAESEAAHKARAKKKLVCLELAIWPQKPSSLRAYVLEILKQAYLAGADPDWQPLYEKFKARRMPLPGYCYDQKKYSLFDQSRPAGGTNRKNRLHWFIERLESANFQEIVLTTVFNREHADYIQHHSVWQQPVMPAAGFLEIIRAAYEQVTGSNCLTVLDLFIPEPLVVKAGHRIEIRISARPESKQFQIRIQSSDGQAPVKTYALCTTALLQQPAPGFSLEQVSQTCSREIDPAELFDYFKTSGIDYGAAFSVIRQIKQGRDTCLATLEWPLELEEKLDLSQVFYLHPSLVDGAFQALVGLSLEQGVRANSPLLPFHFHKINLYAAVNHSCLAYICRTELTEHKFKGDLWLTDQAGQVQLEIKGMTLQRPHSAQEVPAYQRCFYHPGWQKSSRQARTVPQLSGRQYLIFAHKQSKENKIFSGLRGQGVNLSIVYAGQGFNIQNEQEYTVDLDDPACLEQLFSHLEQQNKPVDGICHLLQAGLQESTETEKLFAGCYSFFSIFQQGSGFFKGKSIPFLIITNQAQSVENDFQKIDPYAALAWGMAQIIACEFPRLAVGCCDVQWQQSSAEQLADILIQELSNPQLGLAAYFNQKRYTPRLVRKPLPPGRYDYFSKQGVYVISGGLGAVGRQLTRFLVQECQATVILLSRRSLSVQCQTVQQEINALNEPEKKVFTYAVDITDQAALQKVIDSLTAAFGTVTGLIHAAGVLNDGLIQNKKRVHIDQVLAPKVAGTVALSQAFICHPPRFVALFSTVSSRIGNIGQADYAAANAFLDAAVGLFPSSRTVAINWSYWDCGMSQTVQASISRKGFTMLKADETWQIFKAVVNHELPQIMAAHISNPTQIRSLYPMEEPGPAAEKTDLKAGPPENNQLQNAVLDYLAQILNVSARSLDPDSDLQDYGLDPVGADRLCQLIAREHGLSITAAQVFQGGSIRALTAYLINGRSKEALLPVQSVPPVQQSQPEQEPGKVSSARPNTTESRALQEAVITQLEKRIAALFSLPLEIVDRESNFIEFGMDSLLAAKFTTQLADELQETLTAVLVFDYPSIQSFGQYLSNTYPAKMSAFCGIEQTEKTEPADKSTVSAGRFSVPAETGADSRLTITGNPAQPQPGRDIAVIGMAGRFSGADNVDQYWQNILQGVHSVNHFPEDRINSNLPIYHDPDYLAFKKSLYGSYLQDIKGFDPLFFEISPREAEYMDPQQRLLLETASLAVQNSGYTLADFSGTQTAVYVGACITEYAKFIEQLDARAGTGTEMSILSNRLSYFFNLTGPSMTIDTACSSSLVALDMGCRSLLAGTSDMAIVGGVNLILTPWYSIVFHKAGMLSSDGCCKTFDRSADGYVRGEGVAALILKPLARALHDQDPVLAVIKGSAVNQDGRTNGITAPNSLSQEQVIRQAWKNAAVPAESISLVEAHGTGTSLGDPLEVRGISQAFQQESRKNGFCAIGSVKTNIGHLEACAGLSAVIKVIQALRHKQLPPTLHFYEPNPLIDFTNSPFYVNDKSRVWESNGFPRRSVVSSFGFGGTNAHIVLEEAPVSPAPAPVPPDKPFYIIPVSAKSAWSLRQSMSGLGSWFKGRENIADISYGLAVKRDHFNFRRAFVVDSLDELLESVREQDEEPMVKISKKPSLTALFGQFNSVLPGGAGRVLYTQCDLLRQCIEQCDSHLQNMGVMPLSQFWQNPLASGQQQIYQHILNFILPYALFSVFKEWGIVFDRIAFTPASALSAYTAAGLISMQQALQNIITAVKNQTDTLPREKTQVDQEKTNFQLVALPDDFFTRTGHNSQLRDTDLACLFQTPDPAHSRILVQMGIFERSLERQIRQAVDLQGVTYTAPLKIRFDEYYALLKCIAHLYQMGCAIDWQSFYTLQPNRSVALPGYAFNKKSYWLTAGSPAPVKSTQPIQADQIDMSQTQSRSMHEPELDFYRIQWKEQDQAASIAPLAAGQTALIFADHQGRGSRLALLLKKQAIDCVLVYQKHCQAAVRDENELTSFTISAGQEQAYEQVFEQGPGKKSFDFIIYLWPFDHQNFNDPGGETVFENLFQAVLHPLLYMSQKLYRAKPGQGTTLLTAAPALAAYENWAAVERSISSLCKVMAYEIKDLKTRHVQLAAQSDPGPAASLIMECLGWKEGQEELQANQNCFSSPFLEPLDSLSSQPLSAAGFKTALISGGLSGVGYIMAAHLAASLQTNLILLGRTPLPPQSAWQDKSQFSAPIAKRISNIEQLCRSGATVRYYAVDCTDFNAFDRCCQSVIREFGQIDLMIHAAGLIDSQHISLRSKSTDSFDQVAAAKVKGALAVNRASLTYSVKQVIYLSSLAALSGSRAVGFSDYAAANAFLTGLAAAQQHCQTALVFPVIKEIGMSRLGLNTDNKYAIAAAQVPFALDQCLARAGGGVLIAVPGHTTAVDLKEFTFHTPARPVPAVPQTLNTLPAGQTPGPSADQEKSITRFLIETIARLLKLNAHEITADETLSEYGMDSLSIADLMGQIEKQYHKRFDPSYILEYPTIRALAGFLAATIDPMPARQPAVNRPLEDQLLEQLSQGALSVDAIMEHLYDEST